MRDPTVYVSASCVTDPADAPPDGENWFVLVNAPAGVDGRLGGGGRPRRGRASASVRASSARAVRTPADLERETGAVGGAIYGDAPHGRLGTLRRPGPRVPGVRGLLRVGGTAHPGGGLPLVLLGGDAGGARAGGSGGGQRVGAVPGARRAVGRKRANSSSAYQRSARVRRTTAA